MKALITGVGGQDGSFLADLLLEKGYEVHGFLRRSDTKENLQGILSQINLWEDADLIDERSLLDPIEKIRPDEIYHLAAQSVVWHSFNAPMLTSEVTGLGTLRLLEAIRHSGLKPRIYNAASSEMFGGGEALTEESSMNQPRSPYGVAKLFSYTMCKVYRTAYGMDIRNGILFNHESERRGSQFVTRKITQGVAKIAYKRMDELILGNLDAKRDWGYAPEFVEAMWRIMQLEQPVDLLLSAGEPHSVKEFVEEAFKVAGLQPRYKSVSTLARPWDIDCLWGNPEKARKLIGWNPKVGFKDLVRIMIGYEMKKEEITRLAGVV